MQLNDNIIYTEKVWRLQQVGGVREQQPQQLCRGRVVEATVSVSSLTWVESYSVWTRRAKQIWRWSLGGPGPGTNAAHGWSGDVLQGCSLLPPTQSWVPWLHCLRAGLHHKQLGPWEQKSWCHHVPDTECHHEETQSGSKSRSCPNSIKEQHQKRNKRRTQAPCGNPKGLIESRLTVALLICNRCSVSLSCLVAFQNKVTRWVTGSTVCYTLHIVASWWARPAVDPRCGDSLPSAFRASRGVDQQLSLRQPARGGGGGGSSPQPFRKVGKKAEVPQEWLSLQDSYLFASWEGVKSVLTAVGWSVEQPKDVD